MHCSSPSTFPKEVLRVQGAVPLLTSSTVLSVLMSGDEGPPAPELQLTEKAAMTASEEMTGSRESEEN